MNSGSASPGHFCTLTGGANWRMVCGPPMATTVDQKVKKKFQPLVSFWLMASAAGQSSTSSSALMPTAFNCCSITSEVLYISGNSRLVSSVTFSPL